MTNTLYLPELREMLAGEDTEGLKEFCLTLHPHAAAEFMEGLAPEEAWAVIRHVDLAPRVEIFCYFDRDKQVHLIESSDREEVGHLVAELPPDDRVDILDQVDAELVEELLPLLPPEEQRDIRRLRQHRPETAGAVMTTEFFRLGENMTATEASKLIRKQGLAAETVYYLYVVDANDHLRGVVSFRELFLAAPERRIGELMRKEVLTVDVDQDQEEVAQEVADLDLLAIPVVDREHRLVGIVTHDDVIDVVRQEAAEDAQRIGGLDPLDQKYLATPLLWLSWQRTLWLLPLLFASLLTAYVLKQSSHTLGEVVWFVSFIPMVLSIVGNSGTQSATLVITELSSGNIEVQAWYGVLRKELLSGLFLGACLGAIGYVAALVMADDATFSQAGIIPLTIVLAVLGSTLIGAQLPLLFKRLGFDPALMSAPLVATLSDILGITIYVQVAMAVLAGD